MSWLRTHVIIGLLEIRLLLEGATLQYEDFMTKERVCLALLAIHGLLLTMHA